MRALQKRDSAFELDKSFICYGDATEKKRGVGCIVCAADVGE